MNVNIIERLPSSEEYNKLRGMVGWGIYQNRVIEKSLPNTLYCVCALSDKDTVGMARIIGDAGLVYYIHDVIVIPEYQRQGIGNKMMAMIMTYIRRQANHNTIIGLMAAKGKEPFYERYGFTRRPNENMGSGMTIFWKEPLNPSQ
jgi:ribosomal protein S18 acetylase RimI-like enzyme